MLQRLLLVVHVVHFVNIKYRMIIAVRMKQRLVAIIVGVTLVCLSILVVGIVFIANPRDCQECLDKDEMSSSGSVDDDQCKYSKEANSSGLINFLTKVQRTYNEVDPDGRLYMFASKPDGANHALDLAPSNIKNITDFARGLLIELKVLNINVSLLKPRELKAMAEVKYVLEHNFAEPYDADYYSGDWMLGPNHFCTQYICKIPHYISIGFASMFYNRPKSVQNFWIIRDILAGYNKTIYQYMENMRFGVSRGMVRSIEECLAGIDAIKGKYVNIARMNSSGILKEWFVQFILSPSYLTNLIMNGTDDVMGSRRSLNETVRDYLVKYLGEPLHQFIKFLENENIHHCVPSNISSGLASLPLDHVYYKGQKTREKTLKLLPTGEELSGAKAYQKILSYYTTVNLSAEEIHQIGWKQLDILYPQIVNIAKNFTNKFNESLAIAVFKHHLTDRKEYYNQEPFPENESNAEAKERCQSIDDAKVFCPKRWTSLQLWYEEARKIMSELDPETYKMFYFTGSKHTTPNCPIEMNPNFNPTTAVQSYRRSNSFCSQPAQYNIPFFVENYGPRYQEMSINAHEARPGHHTQIQGEYEHFKLLCPSDSLIWLDTLTHYSSFSEGWGMYAENPLIAQDTDIYRNNPLKKFGMLKGQIWRALRLVVDTGLHYKGMKRDEALELLSKFAWDTSDVAAKEVTRYQSNPGQATSYMIGQLSFISLRDYVKVNLGEAFDLREFHYQVLRHGSVPLSYLEDQIRKYVECKKDMNLIDCKYLEGNAAKMRQNQIKYENVDKQLFNIRDVLEAERYY